MDVPITRRRGVERLDLEARVAPRQRDRGLEAGPARRRHGGSRARSAPARTRHETTCVAPFQLAYTVDAWAAERAAPSGGVSGSPTHGSTVAR